MGRTLQPEQIISHYRVIGPLGAGGMGEVYLAHDETLERNVALKVLPAELVRSEERIRRFVLEAKSASSLSHPNIVTIYEIGQDRVRSADGSEAEPVHFIAMELVSGETLKDKIHLEKTDLRTLLGYLAQAAEGLAKAHAAGIVHRDLKPSNVMVTKDGYAKVLDFGLAKLTERQAGSADATSAPTEAADLTGAGVVMGTVGYMSPEQVTGKAVDHRSDIFSFGCLLYEAATRQRPFAADSHVETMHKILHEQPAPLDELTPPAPAELRRLIRRCLAKSPDQRSQSIKDVAIELREIVDEFDSLSASATSGSAAALVTPPRKGRALVAGVAAVALLGLAGLAVGVYSLRGGRTVPASGGNLFQSMRMTSAVSTPELGTSVLSPDGRYMAYVTNLEGKWALRVRQVATGSEVQVLAPQSSEISDPSFRPDGEYLYYRAQDPDTPNYGALFEVPSLGGAPRKRVFDVDSAPAFSPDGGRIAFIRGVPQRGEAELVIYDMSSGKERVLTTVKGERDFAINRPKWSPDGRRIAAVLLAGDGDKSADVVAYDAETGQQTARAGWDGPSVDSIAWLDAENLALAGASGTDTSGQIWHVSLTDGRKQRITNDQNTYFEISSTADGKTIAARRDLRTATLWTVSNGGGAEPEPSRLSMPDDIRSIRLLQDGTVVYAAAAPQGRSVWASSPGDSAPRQLTEKMVAFFPQPVLEGRATVFTGWDPNRVPHLWRVNVDGSDLTQLTEGSGEEPVAVSPDGRHVLFIKTDSPRELWAVSAEGREPRKIVSDYVEPASFSPDGRLVSYLRLEEREGRIVPVGVVVPFQGGTPTALLRPPPRARGFQWLQDSSGTAFIDAAGQSVQKITLAEGAISSIFAVPEGQIVWFRWLKDGKSMFLVVRKGQVSNIWKWTAGTPGPVPVTDFRIGNIFEFTLSPDESRMVFTQGVVNREAVLIRDVEQEG